MFTRWSSAVVAKVKVTAAIAATVTVGGVGGAVALSQVAPVSRSADRTGPSTPAGVGTSPSPSATAGSPDLQTSGAVPGSAPENPNSGSGQHPASAGAAPPSCDPTVHHHGQAVASVAQSSSSGAGSGGSTVAATARGDCGKPSPAAARPRPGRPPGSNRSHRTTGTHGRAGQATASPAPSPSPDATAPRTGHGSGSTPTAGSHDGAQPGSSTASTRGSGRTDH